MPLRDATIATDIRLPPPGPPDEYVPTDILLLAESGEYDVNRELISLMAQQLGQAETGLAAPVLDKLYRNGLRIAAEQDDVSGDITVSSKDLNRLIRAVADAVQTAQTALPSAKNAVRASLDDVIATDRPHALVSDTDHKRYLNAFRVGQAQSQNTLTGSPSDAENWRRFVEEFDKISQKRLDDRIDFDVQNDLAPPL